MAAEVLFGHDEERQEVWGAALQHAHKFKIDERRQLAIMIANEVMRRFK